MNLPRTVSGEDLVKSLQKLGYRVTRQIGSHIRMTCDVPNQHHVTRTNHKALRVGTLSAILSDVASHLKVSRDSLVEKIFK